jgi:quercetin dioxygenase-like cupin family protein
MSIGYEEVISEAPAVRALQIQQFIDAMELPEGRLSEKELRKVTRAVASRPDLFNDLIVDDLQRRWWLLLFRAPNFEVKLLTWELEQSSDWHDHGGSSGAITVVSGSLIEHYRSTNFVDVETRRFSKGESSTFGPEHVHDVLFVSGKPAVSIHAYSPPLSGLTFYDQSDFGFVAREFIEEERRSQFRSSPREDG